MGVRKRIGKAQTRRPLAAKVKVPKAKRAVVRTKRGKVRAAAPPLALTIFAVTNGQLAYLAAGAAVELLGDVLRAEARRIGLPPTGISISSWVDVPDGGIDATVTAPASIVQGTVIAPGRTGFQVKSGTAFQPWQKSSIRRELFGNRPVSRTNLGSSVRACLDADGRYVLVCTGVDLPDAHERQALDHLRTMFVQCGYKCAEVEIWSQNKLIGMLEPFASLRLRVNGKERAIFQTHKSWSGEEEMRKAFKAGDEQRKFVDAVRKELRRTDEAVHVRVTGEPGMGKTRAVLEATAAEDLSPLVIYCDSAAKFRDSALMNECLREDNVFTVVAVVDECDAEARSYIWNKFKNLGPRIKLITIYNEPDESHGTTVYIDSPPLGKDEVIEIFKEYGVPTGRVDRWVDVCSGSPRVAHVIGANLRRNPEDVLRSPDTVDVWGRYIVGGDDAGGEAVRQRRVVLEHLALFKRFGFGQRVSAEARAIAAIVKEAESVITVARFESIVRELQRRKILQGENTLYITPKALHIKLWADWWDTHGGSFDPDTFGSKLDGNLQAWFDEMFKYAAASEAALSVVARLLGEDGPFRDGQYLKERRGARLFLALTEADPKRALDRLMRTVGTWDSGQLLEFTDGRREAVWALERIVIWRELFFDGARLLLQLAEAENETWGNNASGIFAQLFSPGYGPVSATEASLEERFPVLKEALESRSPARRAVGLKAADAALETQHFSRAAGAERQGLKREAQLWVPKTYGELFDGYRRVWELVWERLEQWPDDERNRASGMLLGHSRGLARIRNLEPMVMEALRAFAAKKYADRPKLLETIEHILHYEGKAMPAAMRGRWQALRDALVGTGFHALMERYVALDLLEEFDEEGNRTDKAGPNIDGLAVQALGDPALLDAELPWLVTGAAKNGFRFGYMLGGGDTDWSFLPRILDALRNAGENRSAFFAGGYFRALRERDTGLWERTLDGVARDQDLLECLSELTWRSGPSDRAMRRLLELARQGVIPVGSFHMFAFGGVIQALTRDIFHAIIEFLLETRKRQGVFIALDLYHFYYPRKGTAESLPKDLTLRLLTAPELFSKDESRGRPEMQEYAWTQIAKMFLEKYPNAALQLAEPILGHFGEEGTIVGGFHAQSYAVLNEIVRRFPREVWKRVTQYLGPPIDGRAYHLKSWLRGDEFQDRGAAGVLPLVPIDELWRWVDESIEERAWYLAFMVPKQLFREKGMACLAREVLVRYGNREDVRENLRANFSSEAWRGPESAHYELKKQQLLVFRRDETDPNVKRWIDEYVELLDYGIEHARIREEREH